MDLPYLVYTTPRTLPPAASVPGRVVVLDLAFAAAGMGTPFEEVTLPFIEALGDRLAAWVDHHDHELQARYAADPRFHLATKADHGACPEMVTPALVAEAGPIDTIVTHLDLDGLYAAAKWILGGHEPYPGADADARAVDTRESQPGPVGALLDQAVRARFRDTPLKNRIVRYLVGGLRDAEHRAVIEEAAAEFARVRGETERLASRYERRGRVAYVDARHAKGPFDKTDLLLHGQTLAAVAMVRHSGMITVAAAFGSGLDFIRLFGLEGGMPTRVSLPESRLDEALAKINGA
ncbi:MAG: hypothetical protein HY906_17800 [Deltaproteobacteria bacterium]|nr:hypothetical protein [Deltaproteobacteria bacterium]